MTKKDFQNLLTEADTFRRFNNSSGYFSGYIRGLRRAFYGNKFGTAEEHDLWFALIDDATMGKGQGYRDGLSGIRPRAYCSQNRHHCPSCSLVSYGKDCQNVPVGVQ